MKIALVHDWLLGIGGAEKVLKAFHEIFPQAPVYVLFHDPGFTNQFLPGVDIRPTFLLKAYDLSNLTFNKKSDIIKMFRPGVIVHDNCKSRVRVTEFFNRFQTPHGVLGIIILEDNNNEFYGVFHSYNKFARTGFYCRRASALLSITSEKLEVQMPRISLISFLNRSFPNRSAVLFICSGL